MSPREMANDFGRTSTDAASLGNGVNILAGTEGWVTFTPKCDCFLLRLRGREEGEKEMTKELP